MTPLVISLGGSLVSTAQGIATKYLKNFKAVIEQQLKKGRRIFIVVGGGKIAREYQVAAKELGCSTLMDLDWVGLYATRLNAQLVRAIFGNQAYGRIICFPEDIPQGGETLLIGGGGNPGATTDRATILMAQAMHATTIVNLTNIDYVYSADPKKDTSAKPLSSLAWAQYLKLIPAERTPGGNYPFDPVASKLAQESGIKVVLMNGENIENFEAYLQGKEWKGTTIADD